MTWPWWATLIVVLAPLELTLLWLPFAKVLEGIQRAYYGKKCADTEAFAANRLGLVTYICGNIGAGKTTMGSALANMLTTVKMRQANLKIQEVMDVFYDLDFNPLDSLIVLCFYDLHFTNANAIVKYLMANSKDFRDKFGETWYDNYLSLTSCKDLLRDYVEAQIALLRNNYVYFPRRRFYNRVTHNFAMDFRPEMMDIKDRLVSHDYTLQKYSTIFEDEKTLNYNNIDDREEKKRDGGKEKFLRLIRQMFKGTVHYITTAQDFNRDIAKERELATSVIYIQERTEKHVTSPLRPFFPILLDLLDALMAYWEGSLSQIQAYRNRKARLSQAKAEYECQPFDDKELERMQRARESALKKKSWARKQRHRLNQSMNKAFAKDFIRYRGILYFEPDLVGKRAEECGDRAIAFDFVFPITYAYGSTDTYAYAVVQDYLIDQSTQKQDWYDPDPAKRKIPSQGSDNDADYIQSLLKKRNAKANEERGDGF